MKSLNEVRLLGNLTDAPEIRDTANGIKVATFTVATNRVWKDQAGTTQEKAQFTRCVAFRGLAEVCEKYAKKGFPVHVSGYIQTREYEDKDGNKRYATEVMAEDLIILNKGPGNRAPGLSDDDVPQEFRSEEEYANQVQDAATVFENA